MKIHQLVLLCLTPLALLAHAGRAGAAPYIPASGSQVLERLPARSDPAQRELAALRAAARAQADNPALAAELARRYVDLARNSADPRYLGYAQAALAPWWNNAAPPLEVRVLRATILQSTHQFPAALKDLDAVVQADGGNAQAWLTRATVLQVTGDYNGARQSCARLFGIAPDLVLRTCLASVGSLSGGARAHYLALNTIYAARRDSAPDTAIDDWVLTLLAEMAARLGEADAAERHFKAALKLAPTDSYLLAAYADFLLDHRRSAEVMTLLRGHEKADALLLRLALAQHAARDPGAHAAIATLRDRFHAAELRGDTVHQREQARYELALNGNPAAALALARRNWAVQKEPADVRILLESAVAARDGAAATEVQAWLAQTGLEDAALAPLRPAMAALAHGKGAAALPAATAPGKAAPPSIQATPATRSIPAAQP